MSSFSICVVQGRVRENIVQLPAMEISYSYNSKEQTLLRLLTTGSPSVFAVWTMTPSNHVPTPCFFFFNDLYHFCLPDPVPVIYMSNLHHPGQLLLLNNYSTGVNTDKWRRSSLFNKSFYMISIFFEKPLISVTLALLLLFFFFFPIDLKSCVQLVRLEAWILFYFFPAVWY